MNDSSFLIKNAPRSRGSVSHLFRHSARQSIYWTTALIILATAERLQAQVASGSTFTKVTTGAIVQEIRPSNGCSWTDINNDGFLDMVVVHDGGRNSLFLNDRVGGFRQVTGAFSEDTPLFSLGATFGDYNNDGYLDVFVSNPFIFNPAPFSRLYAGNSSGALTLVTDPAVASFINTPFLSVLGSWADFNNDGHLDLFVANGGTRTPTEPPSDGTANHLRDFLFQNRGNGTFQSLDQSAPAAEVRPSLAGGWSDLDNDGDLDLLVTHSFNQNNSLFRNDGNGAFTKITNGVIASDTGDFFMPAWGDYDNDGLQDVFITMYGGSLAASAHRNRLYHNKGNGDFERVSTADLDTLSGDFGQATWGDYDNDGFLDLFVVDAGAGNNLLYRNHGDGTFSRITAGPLANDAAYSTGAGWGDYDNDGFLDLYVANGSHTRAEANFLYRNNGNSNNWIKVRCIGTVSNRSAIGAKVRVKAIIGGVARWQMREISSGSGAGNQTFPDVLIGLGDATVIDTLRVEWPSGIVQEFEDLPAKQTLRLVEPAKLSAFTNSATGIHVTVQGGRNREYRAEASTNLVDWSVLGRLIIDITNTAGALTFSDPDSLSRPKRFYRATAARSQILHYYGPDLAEGIALDPQGNIYLSFINTGEIKKITSAGASSKFAQLPTNVAGMTSDAQGNIYVAASPQPPTVEQFGIWKIQPNGSSTLFAPMPTNTFANDVVFHTDGNLYVTDSIGGAVYRISAQGQTTLWTTHALLAGAPNPQPPHPPFPIGANGIAFYKSNVFVANTDLGTLIRVPIQPDGSAGPAALLSNDPRLFGADGVVADLTGHLYVANIIQNTILKVSPSGWIETLADARDFLDGPSSLRFGVKPAEGASIYFVNYAFLSTALGLPRTPSVMKIPVSAAGLPLP